MFARYTDRQIRNYYSVLMIINFIYKRTKNGRSLAAKLKRERFALIENC